jgi:hypothetical protein
MYVEHVTNQVEFLPAQPGFYIFWQGLEIIFSSQRFFQKPWLSKFSFLVEVLFFRKPT